MRSIYKILVMAGLVIFLPAFTYAQTGNTEAGRSYSYDAIAQTYVVNEDSTVDVTEAQTFNYVGEYHKGWRSISLKGVGLIDDVSVLDQQTGIVYKKVGSTLEKTDPKSWGKFTTYVGSGHQNIEWYYNLKDTSHTFVLKYRLHGVIGFFADHDELYWNLATEYDVPIKHIEATVILPQDVGHDRLGGYIYDNQLPTVPVAAFGDKNIFFSKEGVLPREQVTIAASWPKGVISHSAYWQDLLGLVWGWVLGLLVVFTSIGWAIYYRTVAVRKMGRGTIVPQYEPPKNLPPAEAATLMGGYASSKVWAATVVDLAIRGHLIISEQPRKNIFIRPMLILFVLGVVVVLPFIFASLEPFLIIALVLLIVVFAIKINRTSNSRLDLSFFTPHDYILTRRISSDPLKIYESEFLSALELVGDGATFSTYEIKKDYEKAENLSLSMIGLSSTLLTETETETKAYDKPGTSRISIWVICFMFGTFFVWPYFIELMFKFQFVTLLILAAISWGIIYIATHTKRMNQSGELLKEDWLGFKLYLETAERYRMQNLTPETFEKYLPYAMIFGIEKEWAKAFDGMTMNQPVWYMGGAVYSSANNTGGVGNTSGFSPSSFASGFSASFASSFASSGGGGSGGGGGGGSGGGGGGGGGGAS